MFARVLKTPRSGNFKTLANTELQRQQSLIIKSLGYSGERYMQVSSYTHNTRNVKL